MEQAFDAVVAGAGVAGSVAAAVLAGEGFSVLVVEPGQRSERRLAGELLHPPGVLGLRSLGFGLPPVGCDAAAMRGFAVFHHVGTTQQPNLLPYVDLEGEAAEGLALSHGLLRGLLASHVAALPGVTTMDEARATGLDLSQPERPLVTVRQRGEESAVRTRIVVAADGAASHVREQAGIKHKRERLSNLVGFLCDTDALPCPGYGHVFLGTELPVLAYGISGREARVMVDLPLSGDESAREAQLARAKAGLPAALRAEVQRASAQRGLSYVSHNVSVEAAVKGRVVLAGDAGGSCHPLTATGMTVAVSDGLSLRTALRDRPSDIGAALALYGKRRRATQRTRRLLASTLYETCSRTEPELMVIRRGLERYWRDDARGRAASMALLAMMDVRIGSVLREMVAVMLRGMTLHRGDGHALLDQTRVTLGLSRLVARHMQEAMRVR